MEVTAKVDVGENLTSLLERLAQQIGTTADKVFPWYVEQAYLQGVTTLVVLVFALVLFGVVFVLALRKADWNEGGIAAVLSIVSGVALLITLGGALLSGPIQVRKMMNPNFYAIQMIVEDIGKMRGR